MALYTEHSALQILEAKMKHDRNINIRQIMLVKVRFQQPFELNDILFKKSMPNLQPILVDGHILNNFLFLQAKETSCCREGEKRILEMKSSEEAKAKAKAREEAIIKDIEKRAKMIEGGENKDTHSLGFIWVKLCLIEYSYCTEWRNSNIL